MAKTKKTIKKSSPKVKKSIVKKSVSKPTKQKTAPLSGSFFIIAIIGLIGTAFFMDKYPTWSFTFAIVFAIVFVASLISMKNAPLSGLK